ncbi:hypothetical protein DB30_03911 [Enhygromyxa salina]|uniref:Uncharacterized protein n=1 Tax=Enhygromyxa salina TaxID=215803 RepID=A0A0C2DAL6_9BACT|nr:hypothetical protein [Enhygromyxa salina]KIG16927.1 hypothetical protein DB30_03911 [Enhygromyxa salina]
MRLHPPATLLCATALLTLTACPSAPKGEPAKTDPTAEQAPAEQPEVAAKPEDTKQPEPTDKPEVVEPDPAPAPAPGSWASLVAPAPALSKAPADSVLAEVRAHAKPVALVSSEAGLKLVSLAGMNKVLVPGPVDKAMYDPRSGIVLMIRDTSLLAIDLAAPVPAGQLPKVTMLSSKATSEAELLLVYPDRHAVVSQSDPGAMYLRVEFSATPSLALQSPMYPPEDEAAAPAPLGLLDSAWFSSRVDRHAWPAPTPGSGAIEFPYMPDDGKALNPAFEDRCASYHCGASLPLGVGGYELVVVGDEQGDFTHVMSVVHDVAGDRWIGMEEWLNDGAWVPTAELPAQLDTLAQEHAPRFDASGEVFTPYTRDKQLCTAQGACTPVDGEVVDFIAGGVELGAVYFGAP